MTGAHRSIPVNRRKGCTMSGLMQKLRPKSSRRCQNRRPPEGNDPRVMQALKSSPTIISPKVKILATPGRAAEAAKASASGVRTSKSCDWTNSPLSMTWPTLSNERPQSQGAGTAAARDMTKNRLYFGNLMVNRAWLTAWLPAPSPPRRTCCAALSIALAPPRASPPPAAVSSWTQNAQPRGV